MVEDVAVPAWRGKHCKGAAGLFLHSPYLIIFGDAPDGDTGGTSGLELGEVRVLIEGEHNAVITAPRFGSGAAMTALPAATKLWLAAGQNRPTGVFTNPTLDDNPYYQLTSFESSSPTQSAAVSSQKFVLGICVNLFLALWQLIFMMQTRPPILSGR